MALVSFASRLLIAVARASLSLLIASSARVTAAFVLPIAVLNSVCNFLTSEARVSASVEINFVTFVISALMPSLNSVLSFFTASIRACVSSAIKSIDSPISAFLRPFWTRVQRRLVSVANAFSMTACAWSLILLAALSADVVASFTISEFAIPVSMALSIRSLKPSDSLMSFQMSSTMSSISIED